MKHPYTLCVHCENRTTGTQYHGIWLCRDCHDRSKTRSFQDGCAIVTVTEIDDERYSYRSVQED